MNFNQWNYQTPITKIEKKRKKTTISYYCNRCNYQWSQGVQALKELNQYVKSAKATMDLGFAQTPFVDYVKRKDISNETVYYSNVLNVDAKDITNRNVVNNALDATKIMSTLLFAHQ